MNFNGNLLKPVSTYKPCFISLCQDKELQSDVSVSSEGQENSISPSNNNQAVLNNSKITFSTNSTMITYNKFIPGNLLSPPCKDYSQKAIELQQKKIQQRIQKNFQKQLYYGKRKNKVIEISDVSSQDENEEKLSRQDQNNRDQNFQIDKKYLISNGDQDDFCHLRSQKPSSRSNNSASIRNNISHHRHHHAHHSQKKPQQSTKSKYRNRIQEQIQNPNKFDKQFIDDKKIIQESQEHFSHLNPHSDELQQFSEADSDKSIIVIRRKSKPIKKRLRKMVNITNRVKIQNKENQGQTRQCAICLTDLNQKVDKKKAKLPCKHMFCLKCIKQSAKFSNRCPYCRAQFNLITTMAGKKIQVQDTRLNQEQYQDPNEQPCYICGRNDDHQRLLECEFCQFAYCHTYCDPRLRERGRSRYELPQQAWYCASCEDLLRARQQQQEEEGQQGQENEQNQQNDEEQQEQNQQESHNHLAGQNSQSYAHRQESSIIEQQKRQQKHKINVPNSQDQIKLQEQLQIKNPQKQKYLLKQNKKKLQFKKPQPNLEKKLISNSDRKKQTQNHQNQSEQYSQRDSYRDMSYSQNIQQQSQIDQQYSKIDL